jgi:hypothetical protein
MYEQNGAVSDRPSILRFRELVSTTRPVVVERDGHEVALRGYVWGKRIPRGVEAAVTQAYQDFPKTVEAKVDPETHEIVLDARGEPIVETKFEMTDYSEMLTRVACALVEGLSPLEAEVMRFEEIRELLTYLEYLKPVEQQPEHPLAGQTTTTSTTGESLPSDSPPPTDLPGASS